MAGRNELIARYIKLRTGKTRTRKQVSSHIQVLARRRSKEMQAQVKDQTSKERMMQSLSSMSSSQIVSATTLQDTTNIDTCIYPNNKNNNNKGYNNSNNNNNSFYEVVSNNCYINDNDADCNVTAYPYNESSALAAFPTPQQRHHYKQQQRNENWIPYNKNNNNNYIPNINHTFNNIENNIKNISNNNNNNINIINNNNIIHNNNNNKNLKSSVPMAEFRVVKYETFVKNEENEKYEISKLDKPITNHSRQWPPIHVSDLRGKYPEELFQLMHSSQHLPFFLVKYYVNVNEDFSKKENLFYGVTSEYECSKNIAICDSTKVCSFGREVVEKVEIDQGQLVIGNSDDGPLQGNTQDIPKTKLPLQGDASDPQVPDGHKGVVTVYRSKDSPMCEYMGSFISKLLELKDDEMRASVLENLTVFKVIRNNTTKEFLMGMAFFFEIAKFDNDTKSEVYQIVR